MWTHPGGARRAWTAGLVALVLATAPSACDRSGRQERQDGAAQGIQNPQRELNHVETYEWLAGASAPRGCPTWLISGEFDFPNHGGSVPLPPASSLHGGWGQQLAADLVGDDQQPIPDRVELLFYSYLEDKFYHGNFPLPRDSISRLFGAGHGTFDALVTGVAPGGAVAVWAAGRDRQVEVFFGQAELVDLDWHRALELPATVDRHTLVARALAEAARTDSLVPQMMAHVPVGRWASYRTRYAWHPTFDGLAAPARLDALAYLNGERDRPTLPFAADARAGQPAAGHPAPEYLAFTDRGTGRSYTLRFDGEETRAAFSRAAAGGHPIELVIAAPPTASGGTGVTVTVRGAGDPIPLPHAKAETFGPR